MITPEYVPENMRDTWSHLYYSVKPLGEEYAIVYANNWILNNMPVAQPRSDLITFQFDIQDSQLIMHTDEGEEYISAILSDLEETSDGRKFTLPVLEKFRDQINRDLPIGDMDHALLKQLVASGMSDDQIAQEIKNKPGIVKAVKALISNNKLWVRLLIDKRYKRIIEKSKGLSLEAFATKKETDGTVLDADLIGFTVAVEDTPRNSRAMVYA